MTLASQISSDFSTLLLNTDEHAETVTHRPRGDSTADAALAALVNLQDQTETAERGRQLQIAGWLDIADGAAELHETDRWQIRGRWFGVAGIDLPVAGKQRVRITSVDSMAAAGQGRGARQR